MRTIQQSQKSPESKRHDDDSSPTLRHRFLPFLICIIALSISASGLLHDTPPEQTSNTTVTVTEQIPPETLVPAQPAMTTTISPRSVEARPRIRQLVVELGSAGCGTETRPCVVVVDNQSTDDSPPLTSEQADQILESLRYDDFHNMALLFESMTPEEAYLLYRYTEYCEGGITSLDDYHDALDNVNYWYNANEQHDFMQARMEQIDTEFLRCDGFDVESGFELVTAQFHWMNVAALGRMPLAQESYYETIYDLFSINSDLILSNPDLAHEFRTNAQAIISALIFSSSETGFGQFATAYLDGIIVPQDDYQALVYTLAASFESTNPAQYDDQITTLAMNMTHDELAQAEQDAWTLSDDNRSEKSADTSYEAEKM